MFEPTEKIRVFIAIDPPHEAKETLTNIIHELEQIIPRGIRWVRPEGIHLTLKFLGDVDSRVVSEDLGPAMESALADFQGGGFQLSLFHLGMFPSLRQPRVIWAGVQGDLDPLAKLQRSVDEAIHRLGFSLEKSPFSPHLTLGRVRDNVPPTERRKIGEAIVNQGPLPAVTWEVDSIHLIRSNLQPAGAIYTTLSTSYFP